MSYYLVTAFSLSILLPAVIGGIRFSKINPAYYPFLFFIWAGLLNEIATIYLVKQIKSNAVNNNLFYLIESLLITVQFKKWRLFDRSPVLYKTLLIFFPVFWVGETLLLGSLYNFSSYFIILHSFLITLLSISMINRLLARERKGLRKNAIFLISLGWIVFFTYAILVEISYMYGTHLSEPFQNAVMYILAFVNLFTNLLYALAILWIPKKSGYTFT
jgi:hypothetical protein